MFEKFTDRARQIVVISQEEARRLGHGYIGTEHILLGLVREGQGIAAKTLESLGIPLDEVREKVEEYIGHTDETVAGRIPFTESAKMVLAQAVTAAVELGHSYIGTEHVLLGLMREEKGVAALALKSMGATLDSVRARVVALLTAYG